MSVDVSNIKVMNLLSVIHSENLLILEAIFRENGISEEDIKRAIDEVNAKYEIELHK